MKVKVGENLAKIEIKKKQIETGPIWSGQQHFYTRH
jgi:hypothetical protein